VYFVRRFDEINVIKQLRITQRDDLTQSVFICLLKLQLEAALLLTAKPKNLPSVI